MHDDRFLYHAECGLLVLLVGIVVLAALVRVLERNRPGLKMAPWVATALGVRVFAIVVLGWLGATGDRVRGTDDQSFAHEIMTHGHQGLADGGWLHQALGNLHVAVLMVPVRILGDPGSQSLRVVLAIIAVAGMALLAAAVHDLAGPRAAWLTGWLLVFEPTSLLFSTVVQKEALMLLAEGAVVLGAAHYWRGNRLVGVGVMAAGLAVAAGDRPYAGAALLVAAAAIVVHQPITALVRSRRVVLVAVVGVALVGTVGAATAWAISGGHLERLQRLQDRGAVGSRLELEPVNFTTVGGVARGVPLRVRDILVRPYPWQRANLSQQLGSVGTLIAWGIMLLTLFGALWKWSLVRRFWPVFAYLLFVTLIVYAVTTANAGTGFRHRVHLLFLLSACVGILWADRVPALSRLGPRDR